ncbi:MAG: hypothetical protein E6G97_21925 [Alphaproteobacteria bacterium]|nr:MAG: hypothetical protein E6G97_21925 [Alphaproteobacteria bacterium]
MSGPKVFRVVTREEIIAICQGHLARVDAAAGEWMQAAQLRGAASLGDMEAVRNRQKALHRLLAEDRFTELQKQAPLEVTFLQSDAQARRDRAAAAEVEARQAKRRASRTAEMLLQELSKASRAIPDDLRRALKSGDLDMLNPAINRALKLLSDSAATTGTTERQRFLAEQLGRGEARTTLVEWMARQPSAPDERNVLQIDQHLAVLATLNIDSAPFERRAAEIPQEQSLSRRALLADSLIIDLAAAVKTGREREITFAKLRERKIELSRMSSPEAQALAAGIDQAFHANDAAFASDLHKQADELIAGYMRTMAADARRRAILRGLSSLGYEVTEGMATAWVQNGRVVLRKAASPDYGVELGGGSQSSRLQVRAVAFGSASAARNPRRDRDMETIWCGEFDQLREIINRESGSVELETALPVGAVPLKVVKAEAIEDVELPIARTLNQ